VIAFLGEFQNQARQVAINRAVAQLLAAHREFLAFLEAWSYRVLRNSVVDHYRQRSTSARAMRLGVESSRTFRNPAQYCARKSASVFAPSRFLDR
jgi:hypothetical protein